MADIPLEHSLLIAGCLFTLGLLGILKRRNLIFILMSIEVMLNAAGFAFVAASSHWGEPDGQIMFVFIITVAAAEVAIGLALLVLYFQRYKSLDGDFASRMKG